VCVCYDVPEFDAAKWLLAGWGQMAHASKAQDRIRDNAFVLEDEGTVEFPSCPKCGELMVPRGTHGHWACVNDECGWVGDPPPAPEGEGP